MAELVGGAILQSVFGVLLERLTPDAEFLKSIRGSKLDKNLFHRLKPTLNAARAVLNDAELKQFKDAAVKEWLYDLKDAVYQVQDLMDDISTQNQVCHFSSASLKVHDRDMGIKLEAITDRLELIVKHKDILGLKTNYFFFRLEKGGEGNKISSRARHLSYTNLSFLTFDDVESFKRAKALRTILGLDSHWIPSSIGNTIMLLDLKYLRVLSFKDFSALKAIPDSIGEFIHLHFLDLSETSIIRLPDSLCKLYNLQTLKLHHCYNLEMLPNDMHDLVNLRYLGFFGTRVKEMPRGMSKLKNLQILSKFILGKEPEAANIEELGEMQNLMNEIEISQLENIKNGNKACKARMMEKKHIRRLTLSWSSGDDCINDSHSEKDIVDNLQPHWGLEGLTILGYRGTIFPNWLGSRSYNSMTSLCLQDCKNCWMLPPLGQLPALKELCISKFDMVVAIGVEFLKGDDCASVIPFSSLEVLEIKNMSAWEEWHSIEIEAFPRLLRLCMYDCPKLTASLPIQLVSLESLTVTRCPLLCGFIPRCPKIQDIHISGSQNVVLQEHMLPHSLRNLTISGNGMLEAMAHSEIVDMKELGLSDCSNAVSFPVVRMPQSVTRLSIRNCKQLEFLKQQCDMPPKELSVTSSCDTLASLPIEISPILNYLCISTCENLIYVLVSDTPLQNLRSIDIYSCKNLKWLCNDSEYLLPNLLVLSIHECPEVEPFSNGFLPSCLRELRIDSCKKLLAHHREWHLPSITSLTISDDQDIVKSFPEGCSLPATLTTLKLEELTSLETLNCKGFHRLISLQELRITECPKLEKMEGEKLPTSLRKLIIVRCDLLEERCRNKDEEIWPRISHIPAIRLSDEWISFHTTTHSHRYYVVTDKYIKVFPSEVVLYCSSYELMILSLKEDFRLG
ncbi:putative disease resistance RPP13-like protein 1 [Senna tora]|uniref:Putative disease resistance RPP13-like protein 1 n=1 Tax=Senna tora TaxID=362788 RepID=A0A835CII0_9FABA|nr:putative disease resistance RPP13-like protein 1 [Senna tora]